MANKIPYKKLPNWSDKEIKDFANQLMRAIQWTTKLADGFDYTNGQYGKVFRQTNPLINGSPLYSFDVDYATWNFDVYDTTIFEKLLSYAINERDEYDHLDLRKLDDWGRIVCLQGIFTTHDGVAIVESQCFC